MTNALSIHKLGRVHGHATQQSITPPRCAVGNKRCAVVAYRMLYHLYLRTETENINQKF